MPMQKIKSLVVGLLLINQLEKCALSPPKNDAEHRKEALKVAEDNIKALMENKCFTDIEEKYRNKLTGNRVLDSVCSFCSLNKNVGVINRILASASLR